MVTIFKLDFFRLPNQFGFQTLKLFAMGTSCVISIIAITLLFFPLESAAHNTKWTRVNGMR